jgi:hypothetical protein
MGLEQRVERLEQLAAESTEEPEIDPWWQAYYDAFDALLRTLSAEHAGLIIAEEEAKFAHYERTGELYRTSKLYDRFHSLCIAQAQPQERHPRPFALPPAVCDVLIEDPEAEVMQGWSECEDCRLSLPHKKWAGPPHKVESIFDTCPLCGGRVGYYFFSIKEQQRSRVM